MQRPSNPQTLPLYCQMGKIKKLPTSETVFQLSIFRPFVELLWQTTKMCQMRPTHATKDRKTSQHTTKMCQLQRWTPSKLLMMPPVSGTTSIQLPDTNENQQQTRKPKPISPHPNTNNPSFPHTENHPRRHTHHKLRPKLRPKHRNL
jgi:hypothetical protein